MTQPGKLTLSLTACNGKFGVGMTRDQFQDKKDIKIFDEIDKNGNKKLEDTEICDYRDKHAKLDRWTGGAGIALFAIGGIVSVLTPPYSTTSVELSLIASGTAACVYGFNNAHETDKLTDEYRKQHGL